MCFYYQGLEKREIHYYFYTRIYTFVVLVAMIPIL
jgi:hypothetical protein